MGSDHDLQTTLVISTSDSAVDSQAGDQLLLITMRGNNVGEIFPLDLKLPLIIIGRDDTSHIPIVDAEISRQHAGLRYEPSEERLILVDLNSSNGTFANEVRVDGEATLRVGDKVRLGNSTILRVTRSTEPEAMYAKQMYQAVLRDGLTGAFNRRYLDDRIKTEIAFAERHSEPLALLLLDLDHFKDINDVFGHQAGDTVLKRFVELLQQQVRIEDVVARYGGEEFAVLCRETAVDQAMVLAERLRKAVDEFPFEHEGVPIPATVSIGVSNILDRPKITPEGLVEAADKALYAAKEGGRNQCRSDRDARA
jgi:diguanylate cyclase (GGDEF)-like protein